MTVKKSKQAIYATSISNVSLPKKTILQKYFEAGYLEMPESKFTAEDRKAAGNLLAQDYYLGNYDSLRTARWRIVAVSTTGEYTREQALYFKERYFRAIKTVPAEFWPTVRRVCIDDLPITSDKYLSARSSLYKHEIYHQKMLLNMGLERLVCFYFKKIKKSS